MPQLNDRLECVMTELRPAAVPRRAMTPPAAWGALALPAILARAHEMTLSLLQ